MQHDGKREPKKLEKVKYIQKIVIKTHSISAENHYMNNKQPRRQKYNAPVKNATSLFADSTLQGDRNQSERGKKTFYTTQIF